MAIPKADQEFVEGIHRYEAGKIIQRERIDVLETENRALQEKVVLLEEALTLYGQHDEGCSGSFGPFYPCRCGWREIAAKHHIAERWTVEQPT